MFAACGPFTIADFFEFADGLVCAFSAEFLVDLVEHGIGCLLHYWFIAESVIFLLDVFKKS